MPSLSSWYLTTSAHRGGHRDRDGKEQPLALSDCIAHFTEELLVFWHLAAVESRPKGYQKLAPCREEITKISNIFGFRRKSFWFCTEKTVLVLAPLLEGWVGSTYTCRAWGQPGGYRAQLRCLLRLEIPTGGVYSLHWHWFLHCVVSNWADDTHAVAKVMIQNKFKW